ncbi:TnsA-like heteromeric transposase endonuclease subunit [Plantactinospora sonchi]|uniref:TnsA-like heteromeric transposase endonuclease subunit n=1 Tax=Plantactinospora sonchi TaxID=1544735 RepID=A0ABU7RRH0_9ACTN
MLRAVPGSGGPLTAEFEIGYVGADGAEPRAILINSTEVRFELGKPVRVFSSRKRQRHFPGLWWSSTTGGHVGYESWLERDHLMLLDFDPAVVGIASQPFWLFWDENGRRRSHAPDYFARLVGGRAMVVDCRPAERIKPRDAVAFDAMRRACELVGWDYRLVGVPDPVLSTNVRWLAGYRHPRYRVPGIVAALREVFVNTAPLMAGAEEAGDPIVVLPVLFHLLWCGDLTAGLGTVLHDATPVTTVGAR